MISLSTTVSGQPGPAEAYAVAVWAMAGKPD
jgi:hypothetical protein